jgi:tetratricopeptide (TPR) repeat protein
MDRIDVLLQFLRDDPDEPFTRFALAQEYRKKGNPEEALRYFEALAADRPDYVGTYYHLGKLYQELGRRDDAVQTYRTGIGQAAAANDFHARSELQGALLEAQGIGFDEEE